MDGSDQNSKKVSSGNEDSEVKIVITKPAEVMNPKSLKNSEKRPETKPATHKNFKIPAKVEPLPWNDL